MFLDLDDESLTIKKWLAKNFIDIAVLGAIVATFAFLLLCVIYGVSFTEIARISQ